MLPVSHRPPRCTSAPTDPPFPTSRGYQCRLATTWPLLLPSLHTVCPAAASSGLGLWDLAASPSAASCELRRPPESGRLTSRSSSSIWLAAHLTKTCLISSLMPPKKLPAL